MARLTWTQRALRDVEEIANYIAEDSPRAARTLVSLAHRTAETIAEFPRIGRLVPEIGRDDIREQFVSRYRLMYRIETDGVSVMALLHGARTFIDVEHLLK